MDAQAAHEATYSALMTALAGANIIYGPGMLDFGITVDYGQLLFSNDIIKMVRRSLAGIEVNHDTLAVEIINKVGPAGNFIVEEHTMKYMRSEQVQPELIDRTMRHTWVGNGSKNMTEVAKLKAVEIIENYRPTPLKDNIREEIEAVVVKAKKALHSDE